SEVVSVLIDWLSERNHEVLGITGGLDVASWVLNEECDLVLMDVKLPDANGLNLISEIVRASSRTSVVAMSGLDETAWSDVALKNGALDCLPKPIEFGKLERVLEQLSRKRRFPPRAARNSS